MYCFVWVSLPSVEQSGGKCHSIQALKPGSQLSLASRLTDIREAAAVRQSVCAVCCYKTVVTKVSGTEHDAPPVSRRAVNKVSGTQEWVLELADRLLTWLWFADTRVLGGSAGLAVVFVQGKHNKWSDVRSVASTNRLHAISRNVVAVAGVLLPR